MSAGARAADVAIVGAGITGLSIGWHLAGAGARVRLYDGSGVGAQATGIQPGGVRQQWGSRLTCLLAREGAAFYGELDERFGRPVGARLDRCGYLFVAESMATLDGLAASVRVQHELGIPSRVVSPGEAAELVPGLDASSLAGASWCGEDGYVDRPQAVVAAFAEGVRARGGEVVTSAVRALRPEGGGWRLELHGGAEAHAAEVVVAAAHATPALLAPLGVELPIAPEPRFLFYSDPVRERLLEPLVVAPERHFAAKQLADGSVLASDLAAAGDPETDKAAWHRHVRRAITALVPILEYVSFPVLVSGTYDVTPDQQPVLGRVGGPDGPWVAAGLNGRGFMLAPAIGRRLAAAVLGGDGDEALAALAAERFARGALSPERQVV
jgi:sarcosine oxidase subunit beta